MNWISLDWDIVTGDCRSEIRHSCVMACNGCIGAMGRGSIKGGYKDFEQRAKEVFSVLSAQPITDIVVRDSHSQIVDFLKPKDSIIDFDFHNDDYPLESYRSLDCSNWITHAKSMRVLVEHTDNLPLHEDFGKGPYRMFIALSRPYTARDADGLLFEFLMDMKVPVDLYGGSEPVRTRTQTKTK